MDVTENTAGPIAVVGVADHRETPIDQLARPESRKAAENLRRVLPPDQSGHVTVAEFGSSI